MFKKLLAFFHRHPGIKTTLAGALGAAATAAASGAFGPKAAVIAGAVVAIGGLHTKRPADATEADKSEGPVNPDGTPGSNRSIAPQGLISLDLDKK